MEKYILALDQGTTSSRALIFNKKGEIVGISQEEFRQIFPKPGWVEHDPMEIWNSQLNTALAVFEKTGIKASQIAAIGITNQRETTVLWDKRSGQPVHNAIVWQDRRTAGICDAITVRKSRHHQRKNRTRCDAYFSEPRFNGFWTMSRVYERAENGELCFGTIDSWLVWNLSKGKSHLLTVPMLPERCC
ncbi:MAG: FGGY family carbohydrate kinase [Saprospiraceae bacterium]